MKREKMNLCGVSALLLLLLLVSSARAQNGPNDTRMDGYQYQNLSAATVVIIMVMIAVLLCLALFSFYFRHCFDFSEAGAVRQLGASIRRRAAPRGLDHAVLETFPTFLYSEVKDKKIGKGALECAVCLNEFEEEDNLRLIPKCDHVFHPECIDAWLESHVTCPVCRANLAEPCDPVGTAESHPEPEENAVTPNREEVSIRISDEPEPEDTLTVHPQQTDRIPSVNRSRPPRSRSARPKAWSRFPRSHTTGHSLVQPGENFDRFTLRLPQDLRKQMVSRALNRTASSVSGLPMEGSERRGYRTRFGEGSARGGMSFKRSNTSARSGRRFSTMALPFLSRMLSLRSPRSPRSPKVLAGDGEGSTTAKTPRGKTTLRLLSIKRLEPKEDETGSIAAGEPSRPPV